MASSASWNYVQRDRIHLVSWVLTVYFLLWTSLVINCGIILKNECANK